MQCHNIMHYKESPPNPVLLTPSRLFCERKSCSFPCTRLIKITTTHWPFVFCSRHDVRFKKAPPPPPPHGIDFLPSVPLTPAALSPTFRHQKKTDLTNGKKTRIKTKTYNHSVVHSVHPKNANQSLKTEAGMTFLVQKKKKGKKKKKIT